MSVDSACSPERRDIDSHRLIVVETVGAQDMHRVYWCVSQDAVDQLVRTEQTLAGRWAARLSFHVTDGWNAGPYDHVPLRFHTINFAGDGVTWECLTCHQKRPYETPDQHEDRTAYRPETTP